MTLSEASAFAPATVGNVAVGFDVLGHVMPAIGDTVRLHRVSRPGVRIAAITGITSELPIEPERNTAGKALLSLLEEAGAKFGLDVEIDKGIPLGSGLGGSAASAVAAVVAANSLLESPLPQHSLLRHALEGEAVASGSMHADNVAPALFGGMVLAVGGEARRIVRIPVPAEVRCVVVHPQMFLATRAARELLAPSVPLAGMIRQSANLAGFVAGCHAGDLDLIRASLQDVLIEPQRSHLIPGFAGIQGAALELGALGCSISGAGPALFAWCEAPQAEAIAAAMVAGFRQQGLAADRWITTIDCGGARLLSPQ